MRSSRIAGDVRRELILSAAKRCFARHGFAGTTTKRVATEAAISEGLLFKHFPTKAALYAEILAAECEADTKLIALLGREPSTQTLAVLVLGMVRHFTAIVSDPEGEEAQRLRLMASSHLGDGEFARLLYEKIAALLGPLFVASLERAIESGEAVRRSGEPLNLFWFAHHSLLMIALSGLPPTACLQYGDAAALERQAATFILRGIGLTDAATAAHLDCAAAEQSEPAASERASAESA